MSDTGARALDSYTYADYADFPEDVRCEIIGGCVVMKPRAETTIHQRVCGNIIFNLHRKYPGVFIIGFVDVFLDYTGSLNECRNIVQPDMLAVRDRAKIDDRGLLGAPDLSVEIITPFSLVHDIYTKTSLYGKFGVPEYWIVFPRERVIVVNTLENGAYTQKSYYDDEYADEPARIISTAIPGLALDVAEVFADLM